MELRELRYFLAVAREKNITKAADALYISQPSLSKQMQNLEKEIGSPLFVRGSRSVALTETGMLLKKRAEELLELYEKTEAELAAPAETVCGEVRIGGGESYALQTVMQAAKAVQDNYPHVTFRFFSGDAYDVSEKLDRGLIDFGVMVDLPDTSQYNALRLPLTDRWGVLMRRDSPLAEKESISPADLTGQPVLASRQMLEVQEGIGYAVSLEKLINTTGESALCFRPLQPEVRTNLDLVWKKHAVFSKPSLCFLEAFRALAQQD